MLPKIISGIRAILPYFPSVRKGNRIILTLQLDWKQSKCQLNDLPKVREVACVRARV